MNGAANAPAPRLPRKPWRSTLAGLYNLLELLAARPSNLHCEAPMSRDVQRRTRIEICENTDIRTTMNIYTRAVPAVLGEANGKVVRFVPPAQIAGA